MIDFFAPLTTEERLLFLTIAFIIVALEFTVIMTFIAYKMDKLQKTGLWITKKWIYTAKRRNDHI